MRLILIPPYLNPIINWDFVLRELVADLEKKGALKGVEIDIDEGYLIDNATEKRDEEVLALISVGVVKKVREYAETDKYDAIVLTGAIEPGFAASRVASKIPVTGAVHSAVHVASLIGDRFSVIHTVASSSRIIRQCAERYGLNHKLASVRFCGNSSTYMYGFLSKYQKEERTKVPEVRKIVDDIMDQCIAAIEKDRADSLIIGCEPLMTFKDDVRQRLDDGGYSEIPIISELAAGVEMAKAMVNMKLTQAPRAYPSADLEAKPEYW
jgi:allantoin racemase